MIYTEEEIHNEINKNGNTNLIANSGLKYQIYAIGDSHTIFFYNSMIIREHWFVGTLPLTIYRLLNEGLDIYSIGDRLGNQHEKYNICENDHVIFYFGFNDIQKNIFKYHSHDWKNSIEEMFINYISYIVNLKNKYKINVIVSCIYPNPLQEGENINGTSEERRNATKEANRIMKEECLKYNLNFLDIYDLIVDDNGYIRRDLTRDLIHLDYDNKNLRNIIENRIINYCK